MATSHPIHLTTVIGRARSTALAALLLSLGAACAARHPTGLAALCSGAPAAATVDATIDSIRPAAGPALAAARGQHFTMRFTFAAAANGDTTQSSASPGACDGRSGTASMSGELPAPLQNAAASSRQASWRIEGGTLMLDLNPGTRDNNIFVALPVAGGTGHWGLSTFAGEVASGEARTVP